MQNNRLINGEKIGTATVTVDILPKGRCIPNVKITPTTITIHQTGNIDTTAKANHNYQKNNNKSSGTGAIASWHFTVDDVEIYQSQSTNYKCYHAGCTSGNNTSIGIEVCMFTDKAKQLKAYQNAIALVKVLMAYHNFSTDKVVRHYDWTKKICPQWLIEGKFGYTWSWFKGQLTTTTPTTVTETDAPFLATIICDELNIRKDASLTSEVVGTVTKGGVYTIVEVKNGFGRLASGAGWISVNEKYVSKKEIIQEFQSYVVRILADELNVRKGAGTSYDVVTVVKQGQAFTIAEEKDGWGLLKSYAQNKDGWISLNSKYVQKL